MIWFLHDPVRYQLEVDAIAVLEAGSEWLTVVKWGIDDVTRLTCEAEITIGEQGYPITLRYNRGFPFVPPSVLPRANERWSEHQYGQGGELCLEHGPDNWVQELGGADMLISAHRLLRNETPIPAQTPLPEVPSRHQTTLGQDLRIRALRFLVTRALQDRLKQFGEITAARFAVRIRKDAWVAYLVASWMDGVEQGDPEVPVADIEATEFIPGWVVRRSEDAMPVLATAAEFHQAVLGPLEEGVELPGEELLLILSDTGLKAFYVWHTGNKVFELNAVIEPDPAERLEPAYAVLGQKRVGLVGCGSLGSKVAATLARSGIGYMMLVDDDIIRIENLIRHELDWTSVGEHKASALARRLKLIHPSITVDVRRLRLGGQEAAGGVDAVLSTLSSCDLLIDATASSDVFNLLAAGATRGRKPMAWAEVFAGGFGGAVARARPGIEPTPLEARKRMLQWYQQQGVEAPPVAAERYGAVIGETPYIADDGDISVIAAHLSRLALDTLLERTPSRFPYSAYVIGLHEQWLFTQPFDTAPVDLGLPDDQEVPSQEHPKWREGVEGLIRLMEPTSATTDHD